MKIINIPSTAIPWLSADIKASINRGDWMLFSSDEAPQDRYFLDIGEFIVELNSNNIIKNHTRSEFNLTISNVFLFNDVRKPESLSNAKSFSFA